MIGIHRDFLFLCVCFIVLAFSSLVNLGNAKVDPPNYDFSLDELELFKPGKKIEEIKLKHPQFEIIKDKGPKQVIRVLVTQLRYKFPTFIHLENGISQGYYARLPSYFLHDIFHQSLINRLGKQDQYQLKDGHAVYIWENKAGVSYVYLGACTITCFPVFLAVMNRDLFLQLGKKKEGNLLLELESFIN